MWKNKYFLYMSIDKDADIFFIFQKILSLLQNQSFFIILIEKSIYDESYFVSL